MTDTTDLRRVAAQPAEGRALTLEQAVAYAWEGQRAAPGRQRSSPVATGGWCAYKPAVVLGPVL